MQSFKRTRGAIALMITLFFIMALSITIGLGLKYVKEGAQTVNEQSFMIQTRSVLDDFLTMLKTSPQIKEINSADTLSVFLSEAGFIPLSNNDITVIIKIHSARDKLNPKILNTQVKRDAFLSFLSANGVNTEYLNILDDMMGGIKEDGSYKTDIFSQRPYLFRDYIASDAELDIASRFYEKNFHEDSIKKITPHKLFYTGSENNSTRYKMDLNHIEPVCWEVILGCDKSRAEMLSNNAGFYNNANDLHLSEDENLSLARFHQNISYYEPYIGIEITIMKENEKAVISFEYNLESKKGSNFVFEV
jgi:hypothetical protein